MRVEVKTLLFDIDRAVELIAEFTAGKQFGDYIRDALLRSAVERQFEIVGEALNRLRKVGPDVLSQISDYQRIIGFRNVLAHGYDVVSDEIVWDIVQTRLAVLRQELRQTKQDIGMC